MGRVIDFCGTCDPALTLHSCLVGPRLQSCYSCLEAATLVAACEVEEDVTAVIELESDGRAWALVWAAFVTADFSDGD